jgi:hypothetical protein
MLNDLTLEELIRQNIEIENEITPEGDLKPLPGKESALFSINHYKDGYVAYFRYDIPSSIRERIRSLSPEQALHDFETVSQILAEYVPCGKVFAGHGCYFANIPKPTEYPDVILHKGCYVIMVDGKPVSRAWTQNENEHAAELAVETLPMFRRHGYARQVVAAWAVEVMRAGKIAFYSYRIDNPASEALAKSLDVVQYATTVGYSQG